MNQKSFVIAPMLAATALSVIATPLAYADDTVQPLQVKTSNKRTPEVVNQPTSTVVKT